MTRVRMVNAGRTCSHEECEAQAIKKGMCRHHYNVVYWRAHHEKPAERPPHLRVLDRSDRTGDCWVFQGSLNRHGYGQGVYNPNGSRLAHRVVYEGLVGPVPEGLVLDHLCRNPACVNPQHLEAVPQRVNVRRGKRWAA